MWDLLLYMLDQNEPNVWNLDIDSSTLPPSPALNDIT